MPHSERKWKGEHLLSKFRGLGIRSAQFAPHPRPLYVCAHQPPQRVVSIWTQRKKAITCSTMECESISSSREGTVREARVCAFTYHNRLLLDERCGRARCVAKEHGRGQTPSGRFWCVTGRNISRNLTVLPAPCRTLVIGQSFWRVQQGWPPGTDRHQLTDLRSTTIQKQGIDSPSRSVKAFAVRSDGRVVRLEKTTASVGFRA